MSWRRMPWSGALLSLAMATLGMPPHAAAQLDREVRERVLPAAVEIALLVDVTEDGATDATYVPVGSGTIVSPNGLILTNWHVVDLDAQQAQLDAWETQAAQDDVALHLALDPAHLVILGSAQGRPPQPRFLAEIVAEQRALDLAVLQITADATGQRLDPATLALPFVPLGDAATLELGDALVILSYPAVGGDALTYTTGVVSGFGFAPDRDQPIWITTDATLSGGSSGGTAVDAAGRLVGIPTQGSALDCRPGDTNVDGRIDARDVGCIPVGGSIGQLRPINLAYPMLAHAGLVLAPDTGGDATVASSGDKPVSAAQGGAPPGPPAPIAIAVDPDDPAAAYCRSGPVYPPGTRITLPRDTPLYVLVTGSVVEGTTLPVDSVVEIAGPYLEAGLCDLWPVHSCAPSLPRSDRDGYVYERDLRPAARLPDASEVIWDDGTIVPTPTPVPVDCGAGCSAETSHCGSIPPTNDCA